jgi:hypothetical protein
MKRISNKSKISNGKIFGYIRLHTIDEEKLKVGLNDTLELRSAQEPVSFHQTMVYHVHFIVLFSFFYR